MLFNQPRKKKIDWKKSPWFTSVICQVTFWDVFKGNEEAEARNTYRQAVISVLSWKTFCKYLHFWFSMTVVYQVRTTYLFLPASCLLASVRAENTFKIRTVRKVLLNYWCTGICFTVYGGRTWPAFSEGTAWAKLVWQRSQGNELLSQPDCDKV